MRTVLRSVLPLALLLAIPAQVIASGWPVVDVAAIAKLVEQIKQLEEMIGTLKSQYRMLKHYAEIDHDGLANQKFGQFLSEYRSQFETVLEEISGYQNMFDQISRLDEVYFPYHTGWEEIDGENPITRTLKKEILWTRIQMKHAAKVGAAIRQIIPKTQDQLEVLLDDTNQAEGILLTAQIGNQLMGVVGSSVRNLNVQMNEFLQAYTARSLEENQIRGLQARRRDDVMKDWGQLGKSSPVRRNPVRVMDR